MSIHENENNYSILCPFVQTGDDEYEVVPDSKFVVSRAAFKDNSSYYRVNGKKATYKEVATLLRASGIDLDHNRFLILQVSYGTSLNIIYSDHVSRYRYIAISIYRDFVSLDGESIQHQ